MTTRPADWPGIRNGDEWHWYQKAEIRTLRDVPPDVIERGNEAMGIDLHTAILRLWLGGYVDIDAKGGDARVFKSAEQEWALNQALSEAD